MFDRAVHRQQPSPRHPKRNCSFSQPHMACWTTHNSRVHAPVGAASLPGLALLPPMAQSWLTTSFRPSIRQRLTSRPSRGPDRRAPDQPSPRGLDAVCNDGRIPFPDNCGVGGGRRGAVRTSTQHRPASRHVCYPLPCPATTRGPPPRVPAPPRRPRARPHPRTAPRGHRTSRVGGRTAHSLPGPAAARRRPQPSAGPPR